MESTPFVPPEFVVPLALETAQFRLEPLGPQHNEPYYAAWSSSLEHIRATPGYPDGSWPPVGGMSSEANLADLTRHAADFEARKGFTFTVIDPASGDLVSGDIAAQAEQVMRNLAALLRAAGLGFEHVVKTTVYLADMNEFAGMNEVYSRFIVDPPPARATVQVGRLPRDVKIEVDCIAIVP